MDRKPARQWHKGRVVLLGDGAHALLQSPAQGACIAIEDSLCLGELIHAQAMTSFPHPAALKDFGSRGRRACSLNRGLYGNGCYTPKTWAVRFDNGRLG
jgi:2-polyprenyl-6-methoxyphenol hydroxylase-like FAD-dependent oxidoreductase